MSYEKVVQANQRIVGTKQTLKALEEQQVIELIIADDADHSVLAKVLAEAENQGVPIATVDSMKKLGKACGIDVSAAIVAIKK
ncbi:50S ribosomal protein L7ae-like protein [Alteribacter populi]|uniref:50S ribosomal protein L7ae-like protein n=1 Tax=Alteribacter populi TaxID=2011011 RepID=UPI000BBAD961|nr:50S ribosomal protein L7ae-like protein [Alteribacter populi]